MYVYVRMYVCMYVYVYVFMYVCMCMCTCLCMYVCVCVLRKFDCKNKSNCYLVQLVEQMIHNLVPAKHYPDIIFDLS